MSDRCCFERCYEHCFNNGCEITCVDCMFWQERLIVKRIVNIVVVQNIAMVYVHLFSAY